MYVKPIIEKQFVGISYGFVLHDRSCPEYGACYSKQYVLFNYVPFYHYYEF